MRTVFLLMLLFVALGVLWLPLHAQEGRGVIREGTVTGTADLPSLNPLLCDLFGCGRVTELLFPTLFGIDLQNHVLAAGSTENNGLVQDWQHSEDGLSATLMLREDAMWSDGTPITAYDVFFTLAAAQGTNTVYRDRLRDRLAGVVPLNERELVLLFAFPSCDLPVYANLPIVPAHAFDAEFARTAADFFASAEGTALERWQQWQEEVDYDFSLVHGHPFGTAPTISSGPFLFEEWQPGDHIRLISADGLLAYEMVDVPSLREKVDLFLSGDHNFIDNPPRSYRDEIRRRDDVQTYEQPGLIWEYLAFNLADPNEPASAVDDDGNRQEQGTHPIFADVRVRQAVQLAIDVPALIEGAMLGNATQMPANQIPLSWAYDPALESVTHDPSAAEALLEDAGWVRFGDNATRQCLGCLHADEESTLFITLSYADTFDHHFQAARLIAQSLQQVGFSVDLVALEFDGAQLQFFDLYLGAWQELYPVAPNHETLFTPSADEVGSGLNLGSYSNDEVTRLLLDAATVPGCSIDDRAALYRDVQPLLQDDPPYVWLYAYDEFYAVGGGVRNLELFPQFPFWNVSDWVVQR